MRRSRAGISDPDRPTGSFLFLGPTGVGKTELAKALAEFLFDDEKAMVRIDMSEYGEKFSVSRLVGAPPGYIGYEQGGQLTEAVRRRPYSVILLDEVEKAHPEVFDVLLQVLDDGRLTDGQGRTVDFRNIILILTSNLGSPVPHRPDARLGAEAARPVQELVRQAFKPEFVNRLDDIVIFSPLTEDDLGQIVSLYVDRLERRLGDRRLQLAVTPDARAWLAERGYDPIYGARPLRRLMQHEIDDKLARALLCGRHPRRRHRAWSTSSPTATACRSPVSRTRPPPPASPTQRQGGGDIPESLAPGRRERPRSGTRGHATRAIRRCLPVSVVRGVRLPSDQVLAHLLAQHLADERLGQLVDDVRRGAAPCTAVRISRA